MSREITMELLKLVTMVISVILTSYVIPWIKEKTQNEKMKQIVKLVKEGVNAAEQIYGAKTGTEKKQYVAKYIEMVAAAKNINLTTQEIFMLIEAAVNRMNKDDYITVTPEDYEAILANAENS